MTSPWIHLQNLLELGPRPIGSPANQSAAEYIRKFFASLDLEIEEQPYDCTAWDHKATFLEWNGSELDAIANAFSPACEVRASVDPIGTLADLEATTTKGCVLLLYGDLVRSPLSPKSWFLKSERDDRIIRLLEDLQPAAILSPPTETDFVGQLTEDWELDLPAATVPLEVALKLVQNPEKPIHLTIHAGRSPSIARNIIARTPGRHQKRMVLCAHFDTKYNTPGASDNAGGVAALLTLAENLCDLSLPIELEFIAFNGEEYLPMGDDEYLHSSEKYFGTIAACINFDGIGTALGVNSITALSMSDAALSSLKPITQKYPGVVWVEPWPESNHSTFAMRGVPAIAFGAVGTRGLAHSQNDTLDVMHSEKLMEVVSLTRKILPQLFEQVDVLVIKEE